MLGARNMFSDIHRYDLKNQSYWTENHVCLNIASFLLGTVLLGLDALPMEGLDLKALGEKFDPRSKGHPSQVMASVGRLAEGDFNIPSTTTTSRLHKSCMFPSSIDLFSDWMNVLSGVVYGAVNRTDETSSSQPLRRRFFGFCICPAWP